MKYFLPPVLWIEMSFTIRSFQAVLEGVQAMGYIEPTPIQLRAIPLILAGRTSSAARRPAPARPPRSRLPILSKLGQHQPAARACSFSNPPANWPPRWKPPSAISPASPICKITVVFGGVGYGRQNG